MFHTKGELTQNEHSILVQNRLWPRLYSLVLYSLYKNKSQDQNQGFSALNVRSILHLYDFE